MHNSSTAAPPTNSVHGMLREGVEGSEEGIMLLQRGGIVALSSRAASLLGRPASELTGMPLEAVVQARDGATLEVARQTGAPVRRPISCAVQSKTPDGQAYSLDITGLPCEHEGQPAMLAVVTHGVGPEAIGEDYTVYGVLAETTKALIAIHHLDGTYEWVSSTVGAILGYRPEEFLKLSPYDLFHPDEMTELLEGAHMQLLSGEVSSTELVHRFKHRDGHYVWLESRTQTITDASGAVCGLQTTAQDVSRQRHLEEQLHHHRHYDPLTGLPNRRMLLKRLEGALERAGDGPHSAVLVIDIDRFRTVNGALGYDLGDRVLQMMARRLERLARPQDTVARMGSNEFAILIDGMDYDRAADALASRALHELSQGINVDGRTVTLTVSIGATSTRSDHPTAEQVLRDASAAMHEAKQAGGAVARVVRRTDDLLESSRRRRIEIDLRQAIDRGELWLAYQPVVRLSDGVLVGFEALVRWTHPELGPLSPGAFVGVAEESGQGTLVDRWVLREAARQMEVWDTAGYPLTINVNCTGRDLTDRDYLDDLERILSRERGGAHLSLEITESALVDDPSLVAAELETLRRAGIRVYVDDFGTGYSSFRTLCDLPIDTLKVDRSFVASMVADSANREMVRTVVTLAFALDKQIVAEGVETTEQLALLQEMGATFGQGYLFSKPVAADQAWALVQEQPWRSHWSLPPRDRRRRRPDRSAPR